MGRPPRSCDPGAPPRWRQGVAAFALLTCLATIEAEALDVALKPIAAGLVRPIDLVAPPDDPRRFVVERIGRVRILMPDGDLRAEPFLDLRAILGTDVTNLDERGLLGIAFDPGFVANGRLFVHQVGPVRADAPLARRLLWRGTAEVVAFGATADRARVEPGSARPLLRRDLPADGPSGGALAWGPAGDLYLGVGGGIGGADPAAAGGILRMDPDSGDTRIVAPGFRDPRHCAFDPGEGDPSEPGATARPGQIADRRALDRPGGTGALVCADPGRGRVVRIDRTGAHAIIEPDDCRFGHARPCLPVAGLVYRGESLPWLVGRILLADQNHGLLVGEPPASAGGRWSLGRLPLLDPNRRLVLGLGRDAAGEPYVLSASQRDPNGASGTVHQLVPAQ